MPIFFRDFLKNLAACFRGWNLLAHLLLMALTLIIVITGLDWWWYGISRGLPPLASFPGVELGGLLPIMVPLLLLLVGLRRRDRRVVNLAGALGQAAFLGWLLSSSYKALTGRNHPTFGDLLTTDITRDFNFGIFRGGIWWGWPSSHTTVAFATAVTLAVMFQERRMVKWPAIFYAFYVGLAISVSIHWFSDLVAGAILGTVVGLVVGKSFRSRH